MANTTLKTWCALCDTCKIINNFKIAMQFFCPSPVKDAHKILWILAVVATPFRLCNLMVVRFKVTFDDTFSKANQVMIILGNRGINRTTKGMIESIYRGLQIKITQFARRWRVMNDPKARIVFSVFVGYRIHQSALLVSCTPPISAHRGDKFSLWGSLYRFHGRPYFACLIRTFKRMEQLLRF